MKKKVMNCYEKLSTDEESHSITMLLETYQTTQKAAGNLAAYTLSIDTYITNTEKESNLRKTGKSQENVHNIS